MEQLIYNIAGENYLLVELLITDQDNQKEVESKIRRYDCIYQGVKEVRRGWFSGHAVIKILVPEKNILKYNAE